MDIVHIWDQAGVACTLAKYQRLHGHQSKVVRISGFDKFGIYDFYSDLITSVHYKEFYRRCTTEAEAADIIHIHSREDILLHLAKKFGRSKKFILHYHGTDIRGLDKSKESVTARRILANAIIKSKIAIQKMRGEFLSEIDIRAEAQRLADMIIVSTPDLLKLVKGALYLENPVDINHFKPDNSPRRKKAVTVDTEVTNVNWSIEYCKRNGINFEIEVYDRMKTPIKFAKMPEFLKNYETFVDIRYVNNAILENQSKTALEALACGLQVLDYNLKFQKGLPQEHHPVNVVSKLDNIYSNLRH